MKRMTIRCVIGITFTALVLVSCSNSETTMKPYTHLEEVTAEDWQALARKKIYFGHQSVGYNILDGVADLLKQQDGADLKIVEIEKKLPEKGGFLAHSRIGRNSHPVEKIEDFAAVLAANAANKPEVAFFKLCYVDIKPESDVEGIFEAYQTTMENLSQQHPDVRFVYVTTPLTQKPTGLKGFKQWVKGVLGKPRYGIDDNVKRHAFNQMLRDKYGPTGNLFDLAEYESIFPDGTRSTFEVDGQRYFSMVPAYTNDGGHLNEVGRKVIAEKLLLFLI